MSFTILGTGSALPALKISNDDLSRLVDTTDEWIVSKTGIKSRRIISSESVTELAVKAGELALKNAKASASDIDLIICATIMGDTITPSMAALVAEKLGLNCPAFDINAACSGFVYALDIAAGYFARKKVKKVLIVAAEHLSRHVDWKDRATCVLFGDGAASVVLGEGDGLLSIKLTCTPKYDVLYSNFVSGDSPFNKREFPLEYIKMNGQAVYKFAVNAATNDIKEVLAMANLHETQVAHFMLHQANQRIIDAAITSLKMPKEKFINCIPETGNLSAVSIPLLLDKANKAKKLKKGDIIAISAFGAGLTTGACILRW